MMKLLIVLIVATACFGQDEEELNTEWEPTNKLVISIDTMYGKLAHTVEDALDDEKRAFTIMLSSILQFAASDGDLEAAAVDLSLPADVIGANTVSQIDVFKAVLDPAINAVKTACPPAATVTECDAALAEEDMKETKKCFGYPNHRAFRIRTEILIADEIWIDFGTEMVEVSQEGNDTLALQFISEVEAGKKHEGVIPLLVVWFQEFDRGSFPCNLPPTIVTTLLMSIKKTSGVLNL